MIPYTDNGNLIITSLGNLYDNIALVNLRNEVIAFKGKDSRFYKVACRTLIQDELKPFVMEGIYHKCYGTKEMDGCYPDDLIDDKSNIGYKLYDDSDKSVLYIYDILCPHIKEFFLNWDRKRTSKDNSDFKNHYDLSSLIDGIYNIDEARRIFNESDERMKRRLLYHNFKDFAVFYYEILPFLDLSLVKSYDINKLLECKKLINELGLSFRDLNGLEETLEISHNNDKILSLIKYKDGE